MKRFFQILCVVGLILLTSCSKNTEAKKTNFIIFFTDDQGYNDVGCFGS